MQRFHVKRGDPVVIISGSHRGKQGKILEILPAKGRARVEGVAMIKRHTKKSQEHPQGAIVEREGSVLSLIHISLGKAGRNRWLGRRPRVRGVAMNPVDHPNGGGQGKSKGGGGRQQIVSPWGQLAKGFPTRRRTRISSNFILVRHNGRPPRGKK